MYLNSALKKFSFSFAIKFNKIIVFVIFQVYTQILTT